MGLNNISEGGGSGGLKEVMTTTITLSTGATPGIDTTLNGVTTDQVQYLKEPDIYPDPDSTHPAANFGANFDTAYSWDETNGHVDLHITGNWDTDPGSNVTYKVKVNEVQ